MEKVRREAEVDKGEIVLVMRPFALGDWVDFDVVGRSDGLQKGKNLAKETQINSVVPREKGKQRVDDRNEATRCGLQK